MIKTENHKHINHKGVSNGIKKFFNGKPYQES